MTHLRSDETLRFVIADDGSEDKGFISEILSYEGDGWACGYYTDAKRGGIGASLNRAIESLADDSYWIYTTDDWVLEETLSLTQALLLMMTQGYEYVRLGPIHPNLKCVTKFNAEIGWWLEIDPRHGYAFATRPFIATHNFWRLIGPFKEKVDAYVTERDYSDRVASKFDKLQGKMAQIGTISLAGPWKHIGEEEVGTITP